jgi:superfamily I DNA/RNA helicase
MEFDKVIVLGVENEMFWDDVEQERPAYFVAISRAKRHLCLTFAATRPRPIGAGRWNIDRTPHTEFIGYAEME